MLLAGKIHMAEQSMPAKHIHIQLTFITALFPNLKWCMVQATINIVQQIYTHLHMLRALSLQGVMVMN